MAGRQPADVALTGQPPRAQRGGEGCSKGRPSTTGRRGKNIPSKGTAQRQDSPNSTVCPGTGTQDRKSEQREVRGPTQLAGREVREEDTRRRRGPARGY